MMPTQNDGMPKVTIGTLRTRWSVGLSRLTAARIARGIVKTTVKSVAVTSSRRVAPVRSRDEGRRGQLVEERVAEVPVDEAAHVEPVLL